MSENTAHENTTTVHNPPAPGLTPRALVLGALGSALLTASSLYVALRMGALPWPTIFASIAAMSILKLLGRTNLNEINVAQTAMTAGAMIAGGMAFTLPGLWSQDPAPRLSAFFLPVLLLALCGLCLGLALTWYWRPMLLEGRRLPFPVGMAAAQTIQSGDEGGAKGRLLAGSLIASTLFTFVRDWFGWIPQALMLGLPGAAGPQAVLMIAPMAPAIGYMIGGVYTFVLFAGAVLAYFMVIPLGAAGILFASAETAAAFKDTLGLGLMVGAGLGTLLRFISFRQKAAGGPAAVSDREPGSRAHNNNSTLAGGRSVPAAEAAASPEPTSAPERPARPTSLRLHGTDRPGGSLLRLGLAFAAAFVCAAAAGLSLPLSLYLLAGAFLMTLMACLVTGESGIDPMEIFGIIVMMGAVFLFKPGWQACLMTAAVVAMASGFAGDTMFDYRAGQIIGTNPREQLISQGVGGLVGALVAACTLFVVIGQFGPVFSDALPAPQARLVLQMVNNAYDPLIFWSGAILGVILCFFGLPATTLGIGLYLPFAFSAAIFIGGVLRLLSSRIRPQSQDQGLILASGIFGGESLTGVLIAFLNFFTSLG